MAQIVAGKSVGRRLNELQTALDVPPLPVSPSLRRDSSDELSPTEDTFSDAQESIPATFSPVGLGLSDSGLDLHAQGNGEASPKTPTKASPDSAQLSSSTTLTLGNFSSQSTPTSSPRPTNLTLTPVLQPLPAPEIPNEDRYSTSTDASTPDMDRFSTVQLKTPTTDSGSGATFLRGDGGLNILEGVGNVGVVPNLHDDEEDLGTARVRSYDQNATSPPQNTGSLRIHTKSAKVDSEEDSLRTPIAGGGARALIAATTSSVLSPGGATSTKPLGEGVDLLIARLDKDSADPAISRRSLEGRSKLKEDFERLQVSPTTGAFPRSPLRQIGANGHGLDEKTDWDFWGEIIANYEHVARTKSEKLASAIQRGIPAALRGMVWQLMSASKDAEMERVYASLLKEQSPHEKAITRDLGRTFPQHSFFMDGQGIGQENLFNVLKAYSLYDTEVGYCQGLAFIGAALLLNMPDEEAFCVLVRLMYSYGSRDMYLPEMPGLQLRLFQFDRLVEELLPVLHIHFVRQGIKSSMFCSQWFLTMFSYRFPLDLVFRIFDSVFGHGIEAIFGFSLVLLIKNEEKLLKLRFDQILEYMKGELFDIYKVDAPSADEDPSADRTLDSRHIYRANDFVQDAFGVRITPFMLDNYANEWNDLRRAQNAHAIEMDNLRTANRSLAAQVRELEGSLAALNTEHCEIVKQLVMSKIEREDVESELVRYKLMYAEVMHDKEDAMSSHRMSSPQTTSRGSSISSLSISFPSFSRGS